MISKSSLNHIYRTVWNQALGAMVAVAELAPARGKAAGASAAANTSAGTWSGGVSPGSSGHLALAALAIASAWCAVVPLAAANPTGASAIHGQATVNNNGNQLLVTTQNGAGSNHSAINWQSFSIPAGSSTYFLQPDAGSTSINRVVSNTPSLLFGTLGSNGKLVLVNQSGITVGAGAVVDTAGFTASALRMSDADAIAGRLRFGEAGVAGGDVSVQGRILARSGDVVLLGTHVLAGQSALVQAPDGNTILAAGQQIEITARGLEGITMQVQAPTDSAVNLGTLQGDAVGIFAGTLTHSGNIQATAVSTQGGRVFLKATDSATLGGNTVASALNGVGGSVRASAPTLTVKSDATVDVSGAQGGGEVLLGGGFHGADASIANATLTVVEAGATIRADATATGNGGTVVVWADGATSYQGNISARGGAAGGNGGNAEVSGKRYLDFRGAVDLSAAAGAKGTLLLDPDNLVIDDSVTSDLPNLAQAGISLADLPLNSTINALQVGALLATGNLKLEAAVDITLNSPIAKLLNPASTALELHAGHDVNLNFNTIGTSAGPLDIKITADTGSVLGGASLSTGGGKAEVFATAGTISLNTVDTRDLGFIGGGNAGNVTLAAGSSVSASSILAAGAAADFIHTTAGNGGNVTITTAAAGDTTIFPGDVTAYGGNTGGYGGSVGLGGLINLKALNGNLVFGGSFVSSGAARNTDTVRIEAPNGSITAAQWDNCGDGCNANSTLDSGGGKITIAARDDIDLTSLATLNGAGALQTLGRYQANAGNLNITSTAGAIQFDQFDGYGSSSLFGGSGTGGDVVVHAATGVLVASGIDASGGDAALPGGAGGAGGNVDITAGSTFYAAAGSTYIYSYGGAADTTGAAAAGGNGGHINITASAAPGVETSSSVGFLDSSGGSAFGTTASQSGAINISASHDLFLTNGVFASNSPFSTSADITVQTSNGAALNLQCAQACTLSGAHIRLLASGNLSNQFALESDATGDAIVMKSANGAFTWGSTASVTTANGRTLVALSQNDALGNPLAHSFGATPLFAFKQYNVSYSLAGGFTYTSTGQANTLLAQGPASGIGLLFTESPTLAVAASGPLASRAYDGTTVADLSSVVFSASNALANDVVTINAANSVGTYADKNAGLGKAVSVSGITAGVTDTALGGIPVYGYAFTGQTSTTGDITPRALSTFQGRSGNWSNAANWDVLPDGANVLAVAIPSTASVTYDAAAGATTLQSISSQGAFTMAGGALGVTQSFSTGQYLQTGGTVSGPGSFNVTDSFSQTGGAIAMTGPVTITQLAGDLVAGSISGASVTLNAPGGAILQSAALQTPGQLSANAANGVTLTNSANAAAKFSATVSGTGNVAYTNTGVLDVTGITVANGDVLLDNTGAFGSSGDINTPLGAVTIATHSPMTIGGGVLAGGNIQLDALTNSLNSNIVINGNLVSTAGGISVQAYNNYVQNGNLNAALGIDVSAGGTIAFGPGASSVGNPVNFSANRRAASLPGGPSSFVADFLSQFQTALDAQMYAADDPLGRRQTAAEGVVVEGNTCQR